MDTQRLILFFVFAFSGLFLWEAWQKDHNPVPVQQAAPANKSADLPGATPGTSAPGTAATGSAPAATGTVPAAGGPPVAGGRIVTVKTDLFTADVDTAGGVITQ